MYIPDDLVEEIRSRNDIVDIVSSRIKLQKKGSSYFGLCPFHNEKSPSFSVSPNKQMFYCFGCGEGGNVFSFLMKYDNLTFSEALKELADRAGIELPDVRMSAEERNRSDLKNTVYDINKEAARSLGTPVEKYQFLTISLSGILCGLGGVLLSMGTVTLFMQNMTSGRGYIAMAANNLGKSHPIGVLLSSLFFGFSQAAGNVLQNTSLKTQITASIPYVATIVALILFSIQNKRKKKNK